MTDQLKMGLRPKRTPKYRPSDVRSHQFQEQDPEHASYSRPNYVKMSVASHTHQYISPSVILNQNAKLLVKFINKANKDIRDIRLMKEQSQREAKQKETFSKDKISIQPIENTKKGVSISKAPKTQPPKKTKQLYNFKGLHQNNELLKNLTQQQMLKGVKGIQNISGLINNKGIYSGPLSNQLSQLQSLYPHINLKDLNYQNLNHSPNPNLFQFNQHTQSNGNNGNTASSNNITSMPQQQSQPKSSPLSQQTPETASNRQNTSRSQGPKAPVKKDQSKDNKIFKRSAYHVAIAYHIYLKGLYQQGITSGNLIDPTYKARLIKQKAGLSQDQQ